MNRNIIENKAINDMHLDPKQQRKIPGQHHSYTKKEECPNCHKVVKMQYYDGDQGSFRVCPKCNYEELVKK